MPKCVVIFEVEVTIEQKENTINIGNDATNHYKSPISDIFQYVYGKKPCKKAMYKWTQLKTSPQTGMEVMLVKMSYLNGETTIPLQRTTQQKGHTK